MAIAGRFVLVHGTFHGGWCWARVADRLRRAGAEVHAPTLTGLGERAHLLSRAVGLTTHIEDLTRTLEFWDLEEVVLVGHSYGGMVVTGAADACPDRVRLVIYLDATVPEHGASQYALRGAQPERLVDVDGVTCVAVTEHEQPFGVAEEPERSWLRARLTPHPLRTKTDPLILANGKRPDVPAVYVRHTLGWDGTPRRSEPGDRWRSALADSVAYREIEAVHDAMITNPDLVASTLATLADEFRQLPAKYASSPHEIQQGAPR